MEKFLLPQEAADLLNIGLHSFYTLCRNKQVPHVRIGKRIRVPETALNEWIEAQTTQNARETRGIKPE